MNRAPDHSGPDNPEPAALRILIRRLDQSFPDYCPDVAGLMQLLEQIAVRIERGGAGASPAERAEIDRAAARIIRD